MRSVLAGLLLLTLPYAASAAMMTHHDLASLVLESDVVVVADRTGGTGDQGQYLVRRVLHGSGLAVGSTVTVDTTCYVQRGAPGLQPPLPPLDPSVVLFLVREREGAGLRLVPSGLRVVAAGKVFRFEQWSNPGCYVPVPQGPDPEDVLGEAPAGEQMDLPTLERAIARATRRVAAFRALLQPPVRDAARPAAIQQLFGPPRDRVFGEPAARVGFYEDRLAVRGFEALLAAGDLPSALEVLARTRGLRPWLAPGVTDEQLLAQAARADAPVPRRTAAIDLVRLPSAEALAGLVELARSDAAPEVRAAAFERLGGLAGTSSDDDWARRKRRLRATLARLLPGRAASETIPFVRVAIFECAERWRIALPLRGAAAVAIAARRDGDRVQFLGAVAGPVRRVPTPRLERAGAACAFEVRSSSSTGSVVRGILEARCGGGPLDLVVTTERGVVRTSL